MTYKCEVCGEIFDESEAGSRRFCYEDELGLGGSFSVSGVSPCHYGLYMVCPECGSEDFDTYYEDEEESDDE